MANLSSFDEEEVEDVEEEGEVEKVEVELGDDGEGKEVWEGEVPGEEGRELEVEECMLTASTWG